MAIRDWDEAVIYELRVNLAYTTLLTMIIAMLGVLQYATPILFLDKLGFFAIILIALMSTTSDMDAVTGDDHQAAIIVTHAVRVATNYGLAYVGYFLIGQTCSIKETGKNYLIYDVSCSGGNFGMISGAILSTFILFSFLRVLITTTQLAHTSMMAVVNYCS